jgi:hypothetical protein
MKKIILAFLFLPLLMNAQDSISSPRIGLTFGISLLPTANYAWTPGISFTSKKQDIYFSLLLANNLFASPKTYTGFQTGYHFYPYGHTTRFSLLFLYDLSYLSANNERPYEPYDHPNATAKLTESMKVFENYLSFGFRANILRNLFISPSVGIGVGTNEEKKLLLYSDGTTEKLNGYSSPFALTANLNITYHFISLKHK